MHATSVLFLDVSAFISLSIWLNNNIELLQPATLMRSRDPSREFADMAGKSLAIEWLIENAPFVFASRS